MMAPRTHTKPALVLLLACVAQFMVILDVAVVNVALPTIQKNLHIGQSSVQWIVTAYGLMLGGFLLLGGRLGDLWGRRRTLLTGLIVFTGASIFAGIAGSAGVLIAARVVQGLGAAMIPPAALAVLAVTFTEGRDRNRALGIFGATTGISASVGVIASGLLTAGPGWRWIFFINAPIGAALVILAVLFLPTDELRSTSRQRFDAAGAVTATGGLLLLVYAVSRTAQHGWGSATTLGLLAAAAAVLALFVAIERRSQSPLVPRAVARNRTLIAANLSSFLLFGAIFGSIFLGSQFMQVVLGYTPTRTGVAWLATTVTSFIAAATTGTKLVGILGVRRLVAAGFTVLGIAAFLFTRMPAHAHYATNLMPALILSGLAGGLAAPAIQIGALSGVTHNMAGLAGGLVETMREIGGGITVAAVATALATHSRTLLATRTSHADLTAATHAFHSAYWVVVAAAVLGLVTAVAAFPPTPTAVADTSEVPASQHAVSGAGPA
jgi:EmrB/QacA subfamily drug resistance transporter